MAPEIRQEYLKRIINASNTVNIIGKTNIDHVTITGFMSTEQELEAHATRLEKRAKELDSEFQPWGSK